MIFKRSQRSKILELRRCNAAGGRGEDEGGGECRPRKRQRGDEFFPIELLGHVPASGIPYAAVGFRWTEQPVASLAEAAQPTAASRPPVVRTSRGRTQVLPSRFNDSVLIDPWKKEKPLAKPPAVPVKLEPVKPEPLVHKNGVIHNKVAIFDRSFPLSEVDDDDEEEAMVERACQELVGSRNYFTSQSTLTSVHDELYSSWRRKEVMLSRYYDDEEEDEVDEEDFEEEQEPKEEEELSPCSKEFLYGDIVWAKLGKRQPVWPGLLVDPTQQVAPEALPLQPRRGAVLCVMLFGWHTEFSDEKVQFINYRPFSEPTDLICQFFSGDVYIM
jgi:hypothetical protein